MAPYTICNLGLYWGRISKSPYSKGFILFPFKLTLGDIIRHV